MNRRRHLSRPAIALRFAIAFGAAGIASLGSGCVEQDGDLRIFPNGQGRIDLVVHFGPELSKGIREDRDRGREMLTVARSRIASNWSGIAFWTDETVEEEKGAVGTGGVLVRYRGSAWFRDAGALAFGGDPCRWERTDDGGWRFSLHFDPLPTPDEGTSRAGQLEQLGAAIDGFDVRLRILLPGDAAIESGPGIPLEGGQVAFRLREEDIRAGARLPEEQRTTRFHRLVAVCRPPRDGEDEAAQRFDRVWPAMEAVGVPHSSVRSPLPPSGPAPAPPPLDPPPTFAEVDAFFPVPDSPPDWRLARSPDDTEFGETWTGSIRGSRDERIPVLITIPRDGRPCPVVVHQHTWHGDRQSSRRTGIPALQAGVAVVTLDGPLAGSRRIDGRDPMGADDRQRIDNRRWAVSDLRAVIRALPEAPLPPDRLILEQGVVVAGVSYGGPTAITAFALEERLAAAGATVVAGAGAYSAARDGEQAGAALEGGGDLREPAMRERLREAALLDPAIILPLTKPRPVSVVGGEDDGFAPGSSLRRLARAVETWPDVTLRVHEGSGHFLTDTQQAEAMQWIVRQALQLKRRSDKAAEGTDPTGAPADPEKPGAGPIPSGAGRPSE